MLYSLGRSNVTQSYVTSSLVTVYPAVAVDMAFDSGHVRVWSGLNTQSLGGNVFYGLGTLGGINAVKETTDTSAPGVELTLSGVVNDNISLAMTENYRGRKVTIYVLLFNSNGTLQQSTISFRGNMDQMIINEGAETSTITLRCENRLIELNRVRDSRYTDEEQKMLFPDDTGLEYVASTALKDLYWGSTAPAQAFAVGGGQTLDPGNPNASEP